MLADAEISKPFDILSLFAFIMFLDLSKNKDKTHIFICISIQYSYALVNNVVVLSKNFNDLLTEIILLQYFIKLYRKMN